MSKSIHVRIICTFLALLMISTPLVANVATGHLLILLNEEGSGSATQGTCVEGKVDGEKDAKGNPGYLALGLGCGLIGVLIAAISSPDVPSATATQLSPPNKSQEYFLCYRDAYESKSKNKNLTMALVGWLIAIPIYLAIVSTMPE